MPIRVSQIKQTAQKSQLVSPYFGNDQIKQLIEKQNENAAVHVTSTDGNNVFRNPPQPAILKQTAKQERRVSDVNKINNPAASSGVCCFSKVFASGFNTFLIAPRGGVLNPSHTIKINKLKIFAKIYSMELFNKLQVLNNFR